jgi:hypothetical protein
LTAAGSASYNYDPNGNPDNSGDTIGTDNEITSDGTYDYTYDNDGNEITKTNISTGDNWTYGYNNANELVSAVEKTSGGTTELAVAYEYDVFGNLIEEQVTPYTSGVAGTTTTTEYAVDGWNPAKAGSTGNSAFDVWAVMNGSGNLQTRNLNGDGIDQILARVDYASNGASDPSGVYFALTDHLGSVRHVINRVQLVLQHMVMLPSLGLVGDP